MRCIKIFKSCFSEPQPVGAEIFWVEPEPILFTLSRSRKKIWSLSRGKMARFHNTSLPGLTLPEI